jgi:pilus assembly protein CpaB
MILLKPKYLIPLALVSGFIATYGVFAYLNDQRAMNSSTKRPIVIVKQALAIGDSLSELSMDVKLWPVDLIMEGSFSTKTELIGRVVKTELQAGEPVLETKLAPKGSMGGLLSQIPSGMRAMTVSVNVVSGVGGFVLPRTRVDILATITDRKDSDNTSTRTILQDVMVLAVDQTFRKKDDDPITVKSVTLLVTPAQAEKLTLASMEGKLQLVLRTAGDTDSTSTKGATISQLNSGPIKAPEEKPVVRVKKKVQPAPPPPPQPVPQPAPAVVVKPPEPKPKVVEVIRSNQRSQIEFDESGQTIPDKKNR